MTFTNTIKTNRFWQECQRFDRAQNKHEMIETDRTPQAGGTKETL
jgi:hypothetical protein